MCALRPIQTNNHNYISIHTNGCRYNNNALQSMIGHSKCSSCLKQDRIGFQFFFYCPLAEKKKLKVISTISFLYFFYLERFLKLYFIIIVIIINKSSVTLFCSYFINHLKRQFINYNTTVFVLVWPVVFAQTKWWTPLNPKQNINIYY